MYRFLVLATVLVTVFSTGQAQPPDKKKGPPPLITPKKDLFGAFREVVTKPSQCTVRVKCDGKEVALGTIVGPDGWIVTKASQLKENPVCWFRDGKKASATVIGVHEQLDLAMLKVEAKKLPVAEWADSKSAPVGNWLATPGLGDDPVAVGVVSVATRRDSTKTPRGSGGYLGIQLDPNASGVKIAQVLPDGAAAKAGLKPNDIIKGIGKKSTEDQESLFNVLQKHKAGDTITLKVLRGEEDIELEATLGKRPPNRGDFQNSLGSELSERRFGFPVYLQHDSVVKPTDCGGPLVDLDGKVIGINIARAGRVESYAIPSEEVRSVMADLMSGSLAPRDEFAEKIAEAEKHLEDTEKVLKAAQKKFEDAKKALDELKKVVRD